MPSMPMSDDEAPWDRVREISMTVTGRTHRTPNRCHPVVT